MASFAEGTDPSSVPGVTESGFSSSGGSFGQQGETFGGLMGANAGGLLAQRTRGIFALGEQFGVPQTMEQRRQQNQELLERLTGQGFVESPEQRAMRERQLALADRLTAESQEGRFSRAEELLRRGGGQAAGAQQAQILGTRGIDPALARRIAQAQGAQSEATLGGQLSELRAGEALAEQQRQDALRSLAAQALGAGRQQDLGVLGQDLQAQQNLDAVTRGMLGLQTGLTQAETGLANQFILSGGEQAATLRGIEDEKRRRRQGALLQGVGAGIGFAASGGSPAGALVGGQVGQRVGGAI